MQTKATLIPETTLPSRRSNSRRDSTRLAIIEAAESLFARDGIDAVSLRRIGVEIGAGNTAVVLYHFGDKEALIEAILHHRLPEFERRRTELMACFGAQQPDAVEVLNALWLPLFEQCDSQGKRSYAAFLASLGRSQWGWVWSGAEDIVPVTLTLIRKLEALIPADARQFWHQRILACTALITTAIASIDRESGLSSSEELALFSDAMRMAARAFCAPSA